MKNVTTNTIFTVLIFFLSVLGKVNAQCSLGSFVFTTQQQVDDFGTTYDHCNDIVLERVYIAGDVANLNGLSQVKGITDLLSIFSCSQLVDIGGLSSLESVEGDLWISNAPQLANLDGLSSLQTVGGSLNIQNNNTLADIDGLSGLTSTKEVSIYNNPLLTNLDALSGLLTVGERGIFVSGNSSLTNISGLQNIDPETIGSHLYIVNNPSLSVCNLPNFCEYLSNPAETHPRTISGNAGFCLDEQAVTYHCLPCPSGDYVFNNQQQINDFGIMYAHCNDIVLNNVTISGNDIVNLDGLSGLSDITGSLVIQFTQLADLEILSDLTSIGGNLSIGVNASLTNLNGLSNITIVGGNLEVKYNSSLVNVNALSNLTSIEGFLDINNNPVLADISGFTNIDPESIENLSIVNNPALSVCNLPNFCIYLANPAETHPRTISGNFANCLDETAVTNACSVPCPTGNYYFTTQQQIDDFGTMYAHCTDITLGDVTISNSGITNLNGLSNLKNVTGDFRLQNINTLTNTNGLINLTTVGDWLQITNINSTSTALNLSGLTAVGGDFQIDGNSALTAIDLSSLTSVATELRITNNSALTAVNLNSLTNSPANIYINDNLVLANLDISNLTTVGGLAIHNSPALPNLNTLSNLTTVGSSGLSINNNNALTDINGLSSLTTIEGYLSIVSIPSLTHLDALSNLTTLGGTLEIGLPQLTNLDGLSGLTSTGGINFSTNPSLTDIDGLSNITTLGGFLRINDVDALTNLDALNGLTSIGGRIEITRNALLANLNGLSNVQSIQGEIRIGGLASGIGNPQLTDISGLANIDPDSITNLYIRHNANLNVCNLPNFCSYLSDESNTKDIRNNAGNCLDVQAVTDACAVDCNISGNVVFNTQAQIDHFTATYIHCTNITIDGHLTISGSDITDLSGLSNITEITEELWIGSNDQLTNLDGLNNLQSIGDYLLIYNHQQLNNLNGLSGLQSVGGYLEIRENDVLEDINGLNNLQNIGDYLMIYINPQLDNLNGLSNLTNIGTELHINTNAVLTDISGLQNIDVSTIGGTNGLYIKHNPLLSACNLPNFCEYLSNPASPRTIENNAGDCISIQAVTDACGGNCGSYTIWNGSVWSNGEPDTAKKAIINGELTLLANLEACELEVTGSGSLTITPASSFTVNGKIVNNAGEENFLIKSGGNLLQTEAYEADDNEGEVTVERESQEIVRLDYTMWGSPVKGQGLKAFSPGTIWNRIYTYETTVDNAATDGSYTEVFEISSDPDTDFVSGKGYLFRAPNNWNILHNNQPEAYLGKFTGEPFNGSMSVPTYPGGYTSVGNPYPSNIAPQAVMANNPEISTLYFWNNPERVFNETTQLWEYTGTRYVTYSGAGFVPFEYEGGSITVGQGFIVKTSGTSVNFSNGMRVGNTGTFFRNPSEKHRFWLKLEGGNNGEYNQMLIGYVSGATNGADERIDGKMFGYSGSALYNLIGEDKYTIQGRELPFTLSDTVPLGFRAEQSGKFVVGLAGFDGLFTEGEVFIYLKDKELNIIHNLMDSAYEFESKAGEFNERFEVVYHKKSLNSIEAQFSNIRIMKKDNRIVVESERSDLQEVEVYNLHGRILHSNKAVNSPNYVIGSDTLGKGIIVVSARTVRGEAVTKKLINK